MTHQEEAYDTGRHLGMEGAEHVAGRAEAYCDHECERIALANAPRIVELQARGEHLVERETLLQDRLRHAAPPGLVRHRRRRAAYCWGTGIALTAAAFFFSLIGFGPYRLGWAGCLYCLGIAIVTPFAVEELLDAWRSERLMKGGRDGGVPVRRGRRRLLAEIRGDLLARQAEMPGAAVTTDGNDPAPRSLPTRSTGRRATCCAS